MSTYLATKLQKVTQVVRDPQRKAIPRIVFEACRFWGSKGMPPLYYFRGFLYRQGISGPNSFLNEAECDVIWKKLGKMPTAPVLQDKINFYRGFKDAPDVRLARHLGWVSNGAYTSVDGETRPVADAADLEAVLGQMLGDVRTGGGESLFAKPRRGSKGAGIYRLTSAEPPASLWRALQETGYVFQQTIQQHEGLSAVAPDTLNSLRITTLRQSEGDPHVTASWIRFGRRGEVVDNASNGGLYAGVDLDTGRLMGQAKTKFERGGGLYTHHPDTGHPLVGFEVPEFRAALDMAIAAARYAEHPIVGWDVGIAPDGPVVIEGNSHSNFMSDQAATGAGYLDHPSVGPFVRGLLRDTAPTS